MGLEILLVSAVSLQLCYSLKDVTGSSAVLSYTSIDKENKIYTSSVGFVVHFEM